MSTGFERNPVKWGIQQQSWALVLCGNEEAILRFTVSASLRRKYGNIRFEISSQNPSERTAGYRAAWFNSNANQQPPHRSSGRDVNVDFASTRAVELAEEDPLPGTQHQPATLQEHAHRGPHQAGRLQRGRLRARPGGTAR